MAELTQGNVIDALAARGFISQVTETGLREAAGTEQLTVYCGFDPTAPSLHVGNLVPVFALAHFQRMGHRVIVLVGGGTGLIGDPSGRSAERTLHSVEEVAADAERIRLQLSRFLAFDGPNPAVMDNNYNWLGSWKLVEFLRDFGKHFTVNAMLAKESIKTRLEDREQGISFTEFSYMLLQAADFLHLRRAYDCNVQIGGSDQWGNITAGIDLIRRTEGAQAHGLTVPLITTASGSKLGKSEGNSIWLDPELTSPYQFYQYWINTDDRDVVRFLKILSFLSLEEIEELAAELEAKPDARRAQQRLAYEFTCTVHGQQIARSVQAVSELLFGQTTRPLSELLQGQFVEQLAREVPSTSLGAERLAEGLGLIDLLVELGLAGSKNQARQLISQGGVSVNGEPCSDFRTRIGESALINGHAALVRVGKRKYGLVTRE